MSRQLVRIIVIDVLAFAIALLTFAYFHHVRVFSGQKEIEVIGEFTKPVETTDIPDPQTPVTEDPGDFGAAFPDVFAPEGVVEKTENSYRSHDIYATITEKKEFSTTIYVEDIYVRNIENFTVNSTNSQVLFKKLTGNKNVVCALSGDLYIKNAEVCVRNGKLLKKSSAVEKDVLVMYWDGTMETFTSDPKKYGGQKFDYDAVMEKNPYQIWCFGPQLLVKGAVFGTSSGKLNTSVAVAHPRAAIGYYEPGHYCFVLVQGRFGGNAGITMVNLCKLMRELGCKVAFNLDGGNTAQTIFLGNYISATEKPRTLSDVICIKEVQP